MFPKQSDYLCASGQEGRGASLCVSIRAAKGKLYHVEHGRQRAKVPQMVTSMGTCDTTWKFYALQYQGTEVATHCTNITNLVSLHHLHAMLLILKWEGNLHKSHTKKQHFLDVPFKTDLTTVRSCQTSAAGYWAETLPSPSPPPFTASTFSPLVSRGGSNESAYWAGQSCAQALTLPKSVCVCVCVAVQLSQPHWTQSCRL